jgi:hypothetical protein
MNLFKNIESGLKQIEAMGKDLDKKEFLHICGILIELDCLKMVSREKIKLIREKKEWFLEYFEKLKQKATSAGNTLQFFPAFYKSGKPEKIIFWDTRDYDSSNLFNLYIPVDERCDIELNVTEEIHKENLKKNKLEEEEREIERVKYKLLEIQPLPGGESKELIIKSIAVKLRTESERVEKAIREIIRDQANCKQDMISRYRQTFGIEIASDKLEERFVILKSLLKKGSNNE